MANDEKTILKAAQNMIDRYGDDVLTEVDLRIAELGSRGQKEAQQLWKEIRGKVILLISASNDKTRH